jgi:hypothetical protein
MLVVPHYVAGNPDRDNVLPRIIELGAAVEKARPDESDAIYTELFVLLDRPSYVAWPAVRPNENKLDADPKLLAGRQLMRGLKARRDRLISEGKVDEATDQCVAIVRLAPMLDHKGIAIHRLEADAVRHYGHACIAKDRERLSPEKARETARMIVAIDEGREPIADTNLRNREWHNQLTWRHVFKRVLFAELQDRDMHSPMVRAAADMGDRTQCFSRLLALDLLIRAHRAEHGAWPKSLMEVAGAVRSEGLNIDPFSDAPFIYRVEPGGFVLYSVGVDGIDNGGVFPNPFGMNTKGVDLDVDAMIRP